MGPARQVEGGTLSVVTACDIQSEQYASDVMTQGAHSPLYKVSPETPCRTVSDGLSACTVPTPTRMASCTDRRVWVILNDSGELMDKGSPVSKHNELRCRLLR